MSRRGRSGYWRSKRHESRPKVIAAKRNSWKLIELSWNGPETPRSVDVIIRLQGSPELTEHLRE